MPITYIDQPSVKKSKISYLDEPQDMPLDSKVENLISKRPSSIDVSKPINPIDLTIFGKGFGIPESGRALAGGMEVAEGIPADIGIGLQNAVATKGASIGRIPSDIWKTLKGERPAELGDVFRGAGVPEPLAATGGFLASASKFTPTGAVGEKVAQGVGKAIEPVVKPIGNAIKSGTANVMSHLSGVPNASVREALDNPKVLSGKYIKNEVKAAGQDMERNVKPLVNDPNAVVQTTPEISNLGQKLNLYTPQGQSTKVLSTMSETEKNLIGDWLKRADNGSGKIDFNDADKIVGEIDSELQAYYKAKKLGQVVKNTQFDRVAKEIRAVVNNARKSQFPEAGKAIDRYAGAMRGQDANRAFSKFLPKSNLIPRAAVQMALGWTNPAASVALGALQSPMMQGKAIQIGSTAGKFLSDPKLMSQIFRKMNQSK